MENTEGKQETTETIPCSACPEDTTLFTNGQTEQGDVSMVSRDQDMDICRDSLVCLPQLVNEWNPT